MEGKSHQLQMGFHNRGLVRITSKNTKKKNTNTKIKQGEGKVINSRWDFEV